MFKLVKDIISILNKEQRREYYYLQFFVVLTAIAEILSLASIGPFMALVGNIDLVDQNGIINSIYLYFELNNPMQFLFITGLLVLLLLFLSAIISIYTITKLSFFAARTGAEIGDSLYDYYLNKDYLFHTQTSSSYLIKQIATEVSRVTDNVLQPYVQINARIIATLFISTAVFLYNPLVAVSGLTLFFISYYILFFAVKGRLLRNGLNISDVSKKRFLLMNEGFGSIKDVKILNRQEYFISQFKRSGEVFSEAYGSSNSLYNMPRYIMEFIVYSGMVSLVLVLISNSNGDLSEVLPVLAVFGMAAFKLLPSFQQIYSGAAQIKSNISAFESIKKDILSSRINENNKNYVEEYISGEGDIFVNNVSFTYPNESSAALNEINLTIPKNSVIGIVGSSGSGKSTLLDILLGLIKPTSGDVYCSGRKIENKNLKSWQKKIGYVPQNIFIKDGNITENIAFGLLLEQVDEKKLSNAIELSQLQEWVDTLPNGLMTELGEKGIQMSGGQRQRIGIARALYENAEYLFFDEATSALDGRTENLIMNAIDNISGSKTIIMIAHRINTVMNCDVIYMIESGRVVDKGTYSYLIENNEHFKKMATGIIDE
ncbi:MAG: ABC transporter ATP-binding protein/permease [Candidatus Cloacimonetes bacterium]|nr:ABC transporter ATP-binding protein/permease [Candidatus Cloacimonadota bacterium]MDY0230801.1 ABC transporter ATP-binding protein [Candidatus Cloacimonadaceae bacterium]